jgi:hypothetical protein
MSHFTFRQALLAAMLAGACASTSLANVTTTSVVPNSTFPGSTSMLVDYRNDRVFGVYPSEPIASLTVLVRAYPDYGPDDAYCVFYGPGAEVRGFYGETSFSFAALSKGELDRSQAAFNCDYYTHEPHGPLSWDDIDVVKVEARNSDGDLVPTIICMIDSDEDEFPVPGIDECRDACGDAICDGGEPKVSDALAVLKRALGSYSCLLRICDVNHDGEVSAVDALKVLRRAVDLRSVLLCNPSGVECEDREGDDSWIGPKGP